MMFSDETLEVIKNFSTINSSIMFTEGSMLRTMSTNKNIFAVAELPEEIPQDACIYDLGKFLSVLNLYETPSVEFHDTHLIISEGKKKTKYVYAEKSMILTPIKSLAEVTPDKSPIKEKDFELSLSWDDMNSVLKAASVFGYEDIILVGTDNKVYLQTNDPNNPTADSYDVQIGEAEEGEGAEFQYVIKRENLKLLPRDYTISISSKGIAEFKSDKLLYIIATEAR